MKHYFPLFVLTIAAISSCGQNGANTGNDANRIPEKRILTAKTETCKIPMSRPAQIRGKEDISIFPQVNGTLEQVLVVEGQQVKKGQPMFKIDPRQYQAVVDNAQASVLLAEANVQTHDLEMNATKQLYEKGIVAEHQYKVHTNNLLVAQAQLSEAKAALSHAMEDLNHTTIYAPHDGVVGTINYRQGSLVGPSIPEPLTIVSDNSTVYAYLSINADNYIEMVREAGSKEKVIELFPETELVLGNDIVYEEKGHVETISGIIDQLTGSISVRVAFPNPDGLLTAGASGNVRIDWEYDGIVIPRSATYEIQDKHFVYKVQKAEDGSFIANSAEVQVYRLNDSEYIVFEGLTDGEQIVVEGVSKMINGMQIVPKN